MTIDEQYLPVTHKHLDCPICYNKALIEDIPRPRNSFDKLMIAIRNSNVAFRIYQGKKIEVKGE
jgi:hypothetical protein